MGSCKLTWMEFKSYGDTVLYIVFWLLQVGLQEIFNLFGYLPVNRF